MLALAILLNNIIAVSSIATHLHLRHNENKYILYLSLGNSNKIKSFWDERRRWRARVQYHDVVTDWMKCKEKINSITPRLQPDGVIGRQYTLRRTAVEQDRIGRLASLLPPPRSFAHHLFSQRTNIFHRNTYNWGIVVTAVYKLISAGHRISIQNIYIIIF